jgi:hypothetical protein
VTHQQLEALAREAGKTGVSYSEWSSTTAVFDAVSALDAANVRLDTRKIEAAFCEGRREYRLNGGWRSIWTTAPADYDQFGTETAEDCGGWHGRQLRRVIADPHHADYQCARYGSGGHRADYEDPRIEEARYQAQAAREKAEREEYAARREAGLAWLPTADDDIVEGGEDAFDDALRAHGLRWEDGRDEKRRRAAAKKAAERAATWARCRAAFEDGATLVDAGSDGHRGYFGWVKGRDPRVWRAVKVEPHYSCADDAEQAIVLGEGNDNAGTLADIASRLAKGELRVAGTGEHFPPRAVVQRLGVPFTEVFRADVDGRVVWVGRTGFGYDCLVLDDNGHLVRAKAVREKAERAYLTHRLGGAR